MPTYAFRLPPITTMLSPLYGIPKGTFGRGIYTVKSIVLHSLRLSLETYDAQVTHPEYIAYRDRAQVRHPSVHFALDYEGNVHNYVNTLDVSWGSWDYANGDFPEPFPEGSFAWLATYPDVTPDMYCIHIATMSGILGELTLTPQSILNHARIIAYLCDLYEIDCTTTNVVKHETVDTQFVGDCIGDDNYPYAAILAQAQAILAAGGELDYIFDPPIDPLQLQGIFTVGYSRVGSNAYIRTP